MPSVVFLRGVNVGGHRTFRPAVLAKELGGLDVTSIGAAGTFVVRAKATQAAIRSAFREALPFDAAMMIRPAREILDLIDAAPFPRGTLAGGKDQRGYVSVVDGRPAPPLPLPIMAPNARNWQVKIIEIRGRFVLSIWRRTSGKNLLYPNEVVERHFNVAAVTTRNWDTILKIRDALEKH